MLRHVLSFASLCCEWSSLCYTIDPEDTWEKLCQGENKWFGTVQVFVRVTQAATYVSCVSIQIRENGSLPLLVPTISSKPTLQIRILSCAPRLCFSCSHQYDNSLPVVLLRYEELKCNIVFSKHLFLLCHCKTHTRVLFNSTFVVWLFLGRQKQFSFNSYKAPTVEQRKDSTHLA